jgi:hypothetical protein
MSGIDYCGAVWLSAFGLLIADISVVILVLIKVRIAWLRIVVPMTGLALLSCLPLVLVFSGCGLV